MQEYAKHILLDGFYKHIALFKEYLLEKNICIYPKKRAEKESLPGGNWAC